LGGFINYSRISALDTLTYVSRLLKKHLQQKISRGGSSNCPQQIEVEVHTLETSSMKLEKMANSR